MPEPVTPGVYVEEVSPRPPAIAGVATDTAGFAGMARWGPVSGAPGLVTSFAEYLRSYGGLEPLQLEGGDARVGYLAHAARAFFLNGGRRLYVSRVFRARSGSGGGEAELAVPVRGRNASATWRARWPGIYGNVRLQVAARVSGAVACEAEFGGVRLVQAQGAGRGTVVEIVLPGMPDAGRLFGVAVNPRGRQTFYGITGARFTPPAGSTVRIVTLDVTFAGDAPYAERHQDLGLHPAHPRFIGRVLGREAPGAGLAWLDWDPDRFGKSTRGRLAAAVRLATALAATADARLAGGHDGLLADPAAIAGAPAAADGSSGATGLAALAGVDDVAIVTAPDASTLAPGERAAATQALIAHAEQQRYRIALVDPPPGASVSDVRTFRGGFDSSFAALYHPWLMVADPLDATGGTPARELALPPSGFVAGLYAQNDVERGVHQAPANRAVTGALRPESEVGRATQELLNPEGINVFRSFEGRGLRLWGARTISSDPEWKYVNVRRLLVYLEHSIDRGTQWAVFEPNEGPLWTNVRVTIENFLTLEWRSGALMGSKPEEAFFVRCDRSTMTQADLDGGRLVALVGVAPARPAEFLIFRIGRFVG